MISPSVELHEKSAGGWVVRYSAVLVFFLALVLALAFQGKRGLWDPDEGRYSNVALQMVDSGDYLVPRRNDEVLHVTKPPLTYWTIAASVNAFGRSEWSLRLPMALAFALTVALVFELGKLFVPRRPWLPALIYLGSPLPFLAASTITTDTLLVCAETAAMLAYARTRFGGYSVRWLDAMWALFGLAFMIKGPPALLPLLAIAVWEFRQRSFGVLGRPIGLLAFSVIGFSWFVWIIGRYPDLLSYFLGHELVGRIASADHHRNGQWYGGLVVYLPTLVLGALPWGVAALWRRWLQPTAPALPLSSRFLCWWLVLPLIVFFLARSRLPFYLLPLFVPMSLLIAQSLVDLQPTRGRMALAVAWVALLLSTKAMIAGVKSDQDTRQLAIELQRVLPASARELVFVESNARYGLRYYLNVEIEKVSMMPLAPGQRLSDAQYDDDLPGELAEGESDVYYLVPTTKSARFSAKVGEHRHASRRLGDVGRFTVFAVKPLAQR